MQNSRDGWQARPANGAPRANGSKPRRKGGVGRGLAVALPMLLFASMAMFAIGGLVLVVGVFASYSQGLPATSELDNLQFISESVVYDRTGTTELARFNAGEAREPVTFEEIPPILIDAVTSTEDRSFWTNTGVDPVGIGSALLDTIRGRDRGASTITQQLVRQRLLDPELVRDPDRIIERKIKEIIQSVRVTDAYPGEEGKKQIITAYLNQNYYGNGLYGIKAAARGYFGVEDLNDLTLGQVALLAGLPQSPSSYDLVRNAVVAEHGTLYVPINESIPIVYRRNEILRQMAREPARMVLTEGQYSSEQLTAATQESILLTPQEPELRQWLAPHFIWALREELATRLCGDAETCPELERGGLRVTSTLDLELQQTAEKWVTAAVFLPHDDDPEAYAAELGVPYERWMRKLGDLEVNNGAMIAMDYQTGEIVSYVGSAGYYRETDSTPQFQPQFDVLGDGWRQPGSAFKPFNYVTGINDGTMTAASMFMDVTTTFANSSGYTPKNFDLLERGPMRMRSHIQMSLNIGAVKAQAINGVTHVFEMAQRFGMSFQDPTRPSAGLSLTLGTEVSHPRDVTVAFGTLANGGQRVGHTHILRIADSSNNDLVPPYEPTVQDTPVSPQAAYVMTDILASNTDPDQNRIWGDFALQGPGGRRPATIKTGTSQDANDLVAFGYIAPPDAVEREQGEYALVVGTWGGNSDGSPVLTPENPVLSTDMAAPLWHGFLQEATADWPVRNFDRPPGIIEAEIDAWSGMRPTQFTTRTVREVFIDGTVPAEDNTKVAMQVVAAGSLPVDPNATSDPSAPQTPDNQTKWLLWAEGCVGTPEMKGFLALEGVEAGHPEWQAANADWIARAKQGPGTPGGPDPEVRTRTSYTFNPGWTPYGKSWGAPFPPTESCVPGATPSPFVSPSFEPSFSPSIEPSFEVTPPPPTEPPPTSTPPPPTPTPTLPAVPTPTLPPLPTDPLPTETPTLPPP